MLRAAQRAELCLVPTPSLEEVISNPLLVHKQIEYTCVHTDIIPQLLLADFVVESAYNNVVLVHKQLTAFCVVKHKAKHVLFIVDSNRQTQGLEKDLYVRVKMLLN